MGCDDKPGFGVMFEAMGAGVDTIVEPYRHIRTAAVKLGLDPDYPDGLDAEGFATDVLPGLPAQIKAALPPAAAALAVVEINEVLSNPEYGLPPIPLTVFGSDYNLGGGGDFTGYDADVVAGSGIALGKFAAGVMLDLPIKLLGSSVGLDTEGTTDHGIKAPEPPDWSLEPGSPVYEAVKGAGIPDPAAIKFCAECVVGVLKSKIPPPPLE